MTSLSEKMYELAALRRKALVPGALVRIKQSYLVHRSHCPTGIGIIGKKATEEDRLKYALSSKDEFFQVLFTDHLDFYPMFWLEPVKPPTKKEKELTEDNDTGLVFKMGRLVLAP